MARFNRLNGEDVVETTFTLKRVYDMWFTLRAKRLRMTRSSCVDEVLEAGFNALGVDMQKWKDEHKELFDPTMGDK